MKSKLLLFVTDIIVRKYVLQLFSLSMFSHKTSYICNYIIRGELAQNKKIKVFPAVSPLHQSDQRRSEGVHLMVECIVCSAFSKERHFTLAKCLY